MAKKHFDDYYNNISQAYIQQNILLRQMVEELEKGNVDEERVLKFKDNMQPIINNFAIVTYFKFLLDIPINKKKQACHKKMNKKLLAQLDPALSPEALIRQNEEALTKLADLLD